MRIVVTSNGADLDASASPVFGRCPTYVFVDTESMDFEAVENPATEAAGGAGIQVAQFVVERGAQAVVTGSVGPNAFDVLQSAGVPIYRFGGLTVREAVEAFKAGELQPIAEASIQESNRAGTHVLQDRLVTEELIRTLPRGATVRVGPGAIVTPLAQDMTRLLDISILQD